MSEVTSITVLPLVDVVTPVVYSDPPEVPYPLPDACVPSEVVENLRGCAEG